MLIGINLVVCLYSTLGTASRGKMDFRLQRKGTQLWLNLLISIIDMILVLEYIYLAIYHLRNSFHCNYHQYLYQRMCNIEIFKLSCKWVFIFRKCEIYLSLKCYDEVSCHSISILWYLTVMYIVWIINEEIMVKLIFNTPILFLMYLQKKYFIFERKPISHQSNRIMVLLKIRNYWMWTEVHIQNKCPWGEDIIYIGISFII